MQGSGEDQFLIDGFPRKKRDNVDGWQSSDPMRSLSGLQRNSNEDILLLLSINDLRV